MECFISFRAAFEYFFFFFFSKADFRDATLKLSSCKKTRNSTRSK